MIPDRRYFEGDTTGAECIWWELSISRGSSRLRPHWTFFCERCFFQNITQHMWKAQVPSLHTMHVKMMMIWYKSLHEDKRPPVFPPGKSLNAESSSHPVATLVHLVQKIGLKITLWCKLVTVRISGRSTYRYKTHCMAPNIEITHMKSANIPFIQWFLRFTWTISPVSSQSSRVSIGT